MQLTKEQVRARYFACYRRCRLKHTNISGYTQWLKNNWGVLDDCIITPNGQIFEMWTFEHCKISLRPLSAITDEDALEVCTLVNKDEAEREFMIDVSLVKRLYSMSRLPDLSPLNSVIVVDLLRFKGYHTGKFMGYCPIEEGWCILNDKNEQP